MYNCTIKYHNDTDSMELTFGINNYRLAKEGMDLLPELHMHYNKNMTIAAYNTLEEISLSEVPYIVDEVLIVDAIGNTVHQSNNWKRIIFYMCSADENALLPQCQVRFQG